MNSFKTITCQNEASIWTITINRPEALNALNSTVLNELAECLRAIGEMDYEHARCLIITGSGAKAFVAGADIKEISELNPETATQFALKGQGVFHELSLLKIPVIAAVNGFALGGGCELALACDFIYASENAQFGLPEVTLGLIPGFGGTVRMSRAVGLRMAKELTFTGGMIPAMKACEYGLVNQVVPQADLIKSVMDVAQKISLRAPIAVGLSKSVIGRTWDMEIESAQKLEAESFAELFHTADVVEGTKAFIEKRKPQFKGE